MTEPARPRRVRSWPGWVVVRGMRVRVHPSAEELAAEIRGQLALTGMAYTVLTNRVVGGPGWLQAARSVAHELGRPMLTRQDGAQVWAWLKDWPCDQRETEIHRRRLALHAARQHGLKPDRVSESARRADNPSDAN